MQTAEFYQSHLNRVSRSFAFCIAQLKSPLKEWIGLSYLLLRVLDTIEDAPWDDSQKKHQAFQDFNHAIQSGQVTDFKSMPNHLPDGELVLLQDFPILIQHLFELPESVRLNITATVLNMSRGMHHFSVRSQSKVLRLKTLKEVNQYCFFVAGVVGELLTQLVSKWVEPTQLPGSVYQNSIRFGLCLQKVNLLKDQKEDESQGRFLVPNRAELLHSMKADAKGALDYLLQIPLHMREYRLFCAWSLFLGITSLAWIENPWVQKLMTKIPRPITESLLKTIENIIDDNQLLVQHFQTAIAKLNTPTAAHLNAPAEITEDTWLMDLYKGQLNSQQLAQLGLVT
jgi:phytoene/squalene synthetase